MPGLDYPQNVAEVNPPVRVLVILYALLASQFSAANYASVSKFYVHDFILLNTLSSVCMSTCRLVLPASVSKCYFVALFFSESC